MKRVAASLRGLFACMVAGLAAMHAGQDASAAGTPALAQPPIRVAMVEGMSGPFANAGEAVRRNLEWAIERVNERGGVRYPSGSRKLELVVHDGKGAVEESIAAFRRVTDERIGFLVQGNGSAVAEALVKAVENHNHRAQDHQVMFLNYSAVDPALTNEKCSFWHFRFDAHAGMRMHALTELLKGEARSRRVYLIGQDYSFGREVLALARQMIGEKRSDFVIVGEDLHPIGRVKDFSPYIAKMRAAGADVVITGNWGNDLSLLVKAAREAGLGAKFFTFYGNGLGAPTAMGDAGVGRVVAVAEWHPNVGGKQSDEMVTAFRQRFPEPRDDYQHLRMLVMVEMLVAAIERAGSDDALAVATALRGARYSNGWHTAWMRPHDHQLIQPLVVSVMERAGSATGGLRFDTEGSGYGFRTELRLSPEQTQLPTKCRMQQPGRA